MKRSSAAARRSGSDADASDEFAAAFEYVSASQKKIGLFEDEGKSQDDESSLIADMTALNMLVRGAMCPTCRHLGLCVREPADKRKGLASFVELHCPNSECPEAILSATYTSRREASGGEASVSAAGDELTARRTYDSGSQLERAVMAKPMVLAHFNGSGHYKEDCSFLCTNFIAFNDIFDK
ncbi:hypothetical protein HPB50_012124 [Hyalomma asiaticum]|uniref:Uncharacterized protein n=1 Tax=Hyalomma asiaticum TaxID=266040 RepID=A0ACB7S091_HYAAI|nr:hypothetical protein HPB50_012124 [Hyalomma asiaticum]